MDAQKKVEDIDFSVHPAILESVVTAQAGSLFKGLLEMLMNSIDAKATRVDIDLDNDSFKISDDGEGFKDEETVEKCFGCFGTPQTEDKTYGKFRIGRGQIFSFAPNTWRSGRFEMSVDLRNKGLRYGLKVHDESVPGCVISGTFYEPLDYSGFYATERDFTNAAAYVPIPVHLNGEQINKVPEKQEWDYETDDAYIKKIPYRGLEVYNQGVLCKTFSARDYGFSGVVVSKVPLAVNFARNDILLNQCSVWKRVAALLKKEGQGALLKKRRLSWEEQSYIAEKFMAEELSYLQIRESPILTDIAGNSLSFKTLWMEKKVTVCFDKKSSLADSVQSSGVARVLDKETFDRFGFEDMEEFVDTMGSAIEQEMGTLDCPSEDYDIIARDLDRLTQTGFCYSVEAFADQFNGGYFILEDEELTPTERLLLQAVNYGERFVRSALWHSRAVHELLPPRTILVGESDTAEAWTDGHSIIVIHRKWLRKLLSGIEWFQFVANLLCHEYLHDDTDQDSHMHSAAFHNAYHQAALFTVRYRDECDLFTGAKKMAAKYVSILRKKNRSVPKSLARFGGVSVTDKEWYRDRLRSQETEIHNLKGDLIAHKLASPRIVEPERLIFYRNEYGSLSIEFSMTMSGPVIHLSRKTIPLREGWGNKSISGRISKKIASAVVDNAPEWRVWFCTSSYYSNVEVDLPGLTEEDREGFREDLGLELRVSYVDPGGNIEAQSFYSTRVFKALCDWVKKEPELAEVCGQDPDSFKEWYRLALQQNNTGA